MKYLLIIPLLFLCSCRAFTSPDPEPAVLAVHHLTQEYNNALEFIEKVFEEATDVDPDLKTNVLTLIKESQKDRKETTDFLIRYLRSFGELDSSEIISIILKYNTLRNTQ